MATIIKEKTYAGFAEYWQKHPNMTHQQAQLNWRREEYLHKNPTSPQATKSSASKIETVAKEPAPAPVEQPAPQPAPVQPVAPVQDPTPVPAPAPAPAVEQAPVPVTAPVVEKPAPQTMTSEQLRDKYLKSSGFDIANPIAVPTDDDIRQIRDVYWKSLEDNHTEEQKAALRFNRLRRLRLASQQDFSKGSLSPEERKKIQQRYSGGWYRDMEDKLTDKDGPDAQVSDEDFWDTFGGELMKSFAHGAAGTATAMGTGAGALIKRTTGWAGLYDASMAGTSFLDDALAVKHPDWGDKIANGLGSTMITLIPGMGMGSMLSRATWATRAAKVLTSGGGVGKFLSVASKIVGGSRGVIGGGASGLFESIAESGDTIRQGLAMGMDEKDAFDAGQRTVLPNIAIGSVTNFTVFSPALRGKGIMKIVGNKWFRVFGGGAGEFFQEEEQGQAQDWALGIQGFTLSVRHFDEAVVGFVVGGGMGSVKAFTTRSPKITELTGEVEQGMTTEENDLDQALNYTQEAMTLDDMTLGAKIVELKSKLPVNEDGQYDARGATMEMREFVALKALMNEAARRDALKTVEANHTQASLDEQLRTAAKIGYSRLTEGEQGFVSLAINSLTKNGNLDPQLGAELAAQISAHSGHAMALNKVASENFEKQSGEEFAGHVALNQSPTGEWVVWAQDKDHNFEARGFDSRKEAEQYRKVVSEQVFKAIPGVQPEPTHGQMMNEPSVQPTETEQAPVVKKDTQQQEPVTPVDETARQVPEGTRVWNVNKSGELKASETTDAYSIDVLPEDSNEGTAKLSDAGKQVMELAQNANINVKFFAPTEEQAGLGGLYDHRTHTIFVNSALQDETSGSVANLTDMVIAHEFGHWMAVHNYDASVKMFDWIKTNKPEVLVQNRARVESGGYERSQYHSEDIAESLAAYVIENKGFNQLVDEAPGPVRQIIRDFANWMGVKDLQSESPSFAGTWKSRIMTSLLGEGVSFKGNEHIGEVMGEQERVASVKAKIKAAKRTWNGVSEFMNRVVYKHLMDRKHGLKDLLTRPYERGSEAHKAGTVAYVTERLRAGAGGIWETMVNNAVYYRSRGSYEKGGYERIKNKEGNPVKAPRKILQEYDMTGKRYEDFGTYLTAKRIVAEAEHSIQKAQEKGEQWSPSKEVEERVKNARKIKEYFDKSDGFQEAARDFNDFADALIEYQNDEGFFKPGEAEKITSSRDFFVPLLSLKENEALGLGRNQAKPAKSVRMMGELSDKATAHPVAALISNALHVVKNTEINASIKSVIEASKYGGEDFARRVGMTPVSRLADTDQLVKATGVLNKVKGLISDMADEGSLSRESANGILKELDRKTKGGRLDVLNDLPPAVKIWLAGTELGENMVAYYDGGELQVYEVDPVIYDVFSSSKESYTWVMRAGAKMTQLLRTGAIMNPDFQSRNLLRDHFDAFLGLATINTPMDAVRFSKAWGKAWKSVFNQDFDYQQLGMARGLMADQLSFLRGDYDQKVKELMRRGSYTKKDVAIYVAKNPIQALYQLIGFGTRMSEEVTRLAALKVSLESRHREHPELGWAQLAQIAGMDTRDSTLDFARMGTSIKALNMLIPFYNVGFQGPDKAFRALTSPNAGHRKAAWFKSIVAVTLPSLLLHSHNKDQEWYKELPNWEKNMFWHFAYGKTRVRLPKPPGYAMLFSSLPERLWDNLGGDPFAIKEWAHQVVEQSPLGVGVALQQMAPMMSAWKNTEANYDPWRGSPIVKGGLNNRLAFQQFSDSNKRVSRWLMKLLYEKTNGNLDISPAKAEYWAKASFAGFAGYTLSAADAVFVGLDKIHGVDDGPQAAGYGAFYEMPVFRSFFKPKVTKYGKSMSRFFKIYEKAVKAQNSYKAAARNNDAEEMAMILEAEGDLVVSYDNLHSAAIDMRKVTLAARAKGVDDRLTPIERRDQRDEILEYRSHMISEYMGVYLSKEERERRKRLVEYAIDRILKLANK